MHGTIYAGGMIYRVNQKGEVTYSDRNGGWCTPSGKWRILGARRLHNFGTEAEKLSFEELDRLNSRYGTAHYDGLGWKFKNGKQKWHVLDLDHGTERLWWSPDHYGIFYPD